MRDSAIKSTWYKDSFVVLVTVTSSQTRG